MQVKDLERHISKTETNVKCRYDVFLDIQKITTDESEIIKLLRPKSFLLKTPKYLCV